MGYYYSRLSYLYLTISRLANSRNATCEATLTFRNSTFLSYTMLAIPKECAGDQVAKIRIPESSPNGVMAVEWYGAQSS